jgi:predicted nucleotidyltransferase
MLTIVDEFTRECLAIDVSRKLTSEDVLERLSDLFVRKGVPDHIRSDNGSEFTAKRVREWLERVVLACRWIEQGLGIVPMAFDALVERVVDDFSLVAAIRDLVERKKAGEELDRGPRIPALSDFLDAEIVRLTAKAIPPATPSSMSLLDEAFVACLTQVYGDRLFPP